MLYKIRLDTSCIAECCGEIIIYTMSQYENKDLSIMYRFSDIGLHNKSSMKHKW